MVTWVLNDLFPRGSSMSLSHGRVLGARLFALPITALLGLSGIFRPCSPGQENARTRYGSSKSLGVQDADESTSVIKSHQLGSVIIPAVRLSHDIDRVNVTWRINISGDSSVYTIGTMGKTKVVCTKLSRVGRGRGEAIAAGNAITRLLGTFSRIEHVIVAGVGGAVPNPADYEKHVRLGDVVVSFAPTPKTPTYIHCDKMEPVNGDYNFSTRTWYPKERKMQNVAAGMRDLLKQFQAKYPWEIYLEEGKEAMSSDESVFHKPASKTDRVFLPEPDGSVVEYQHPAPPPGHTLREGQPRIHYGAIGAGRFVSRNEAIRLDFADLTGVLAFDYEFYAVLESLEGNRCDSFVVIRGMADYADGTKQKDWQNYSALVASAFTKAFVLALRG